MVKLHSYHDISAPRDTIWELLIDFGNIEAWWPKNSPIDIDRVELDGSGVGMVRHIYNAGFTNAVSERLDSLDLEKHTYILSIVGNRPAGLLHYQATGKLTALGNDGCRLTYDSEFLAEEGREDEARQFLLGAYELMYAGLDGVSD
jgi:carbon monoxide dehydrogenase subunit G